MQKVPINEVTTEEAYLPNAYEWTFPETQEVTYNRPWAYIFASLVWSIIKTGGLVLWLCLVLIGYFLLLLWEYVLVPGFWGVCSKFVWLYHEWGIPLFRLVRWLVWD